MQEKEIEKRKRELLKKFGSVAKIKEVTVEELMEIKGITREIAENIKKTIK